MGVLAVLDKVLKQASVRLPALTMGSGRGGPVGASVLLPVSEYNKLQAELATAPVLTPPHHPTQPANLAKEAADTQRTVTTCLTAQLMADGDLGLPSLPVLSHAVWEYRSQPGSATAPPQNMVDKTVLD